MFSLLGAGNGPATGGQAIPATIPAADAPDFPYEKQPAVLSPAERNFLAALRVAMSLQPTPTPSLDITHTLLIKPRIADIIKVQPGLDNSRRTKAQNKINAKHFDFVLIDAASTEPVVAIELDDRSHERDRTKLRDQFVDAACGAAGLAIVHVKASRQYAPSALRGQLGL